MSDAVENWLVQVSWKSPRGTLINVRAATPADLEISLKEMADLTEAILEGEAALAAPRVQPNLQPQGEAPQQQYQQPQAPQQGGYPPQGVPQQMMSAPMCLHGQPAKYVKGGISKTGRPYQAFWACANPRGQECDWRQSA